jgi:hypothetical protein
MSGGFHGAIFDVEGVLIGSPDEQGEGRLVAFADALRFVLAVKQAGMRVAAVSPSPSSGAVGEELRELAPGTQAGFRLGRDRNVPDAT